VQVENLCRAFVRNADGSWTCVANATLFHPLGRIQVTEGTVFFPGTTFMGVDLAEWLSAACARATTAS
jgi:hypothetical protein